MQVQMKYDPREDRILLRVNSDQADEFRFWLTRRFAERLVPALTRELHQQAPVSPAADPSSRRDAVAFVHQRSVAEGDFQTPFREEARQYPLGTQPVLAGRSSLQRTETGGLTMSIAPLEGQGITLTLTPSILHVICELLAKALKQADWGIELDLHGESERPKTAHIN